MTLMLLEGTESESDSDVSYEAVLEGVLDRTFWKGTRARAH